jgi:hypothetical protein
VDAGTDESRCKGLGGPKQMYRILTQDVNEEDIRDILDARFDAYTLLPAEGVWKRQPEKSLVIEVDCKACGEQVRDAALAIKANNKQEAVLVQELSTTSELV